jgi:hypothetical protein
MRESLSGRAIAASMRGAAAVAIVVFVMAGLSAGSRPGTAASCGRPDYPDLDSFSNEAIVDQALWNDLSSSGGFANGSEGAGHVSLFVAGTSRNATLSIDERVVVEYVGGAPTNRSILHVSVRLEESGGGVLDRTFRTVSLGGRGGGNLTIVARADGDLLLVFWRWAYLPCDEAFPNSYYVFHAALDGTVITHDNELVYFEAPRPRRSPPVDLVLLVVAGVAVSVIFLLARHALRQKG